MKLSIVDVWLAFKYVSEPGEYIQGSTQDTRKHLRWKALQENSETAFCDLLLL